MEEKSKPKKISRTLVVILIITIIGPMIMAFNKNINYGVNWRTADRSSTGISPSPHKVNEAIVQVFAARAFNWRGIFGVHTWIAVKPKNAMKYTVYQVVGWRSWQGLPVVISEPDIPDRSWYGQAPEIIVDIRGTTADTIIEDVKIAVARYPNKGKYVMWPGPNSNTFTAYIGREVPQLEMNLPSTAIGKDFLVNGKFFAYSPSNTGYQFSLFGLLGILIGKKEGIELNVLGLVFGIDPFGIGIKLPGLGKVGFNLR